MDEKQHNYPIWLPNWLLAKIIRSNWKGNHLLWHCQGFIKSTISFISIFVWIYSLIFNKNHQTVEHSQEGKEQSQPHNYLTLTLSSLANKNPKSSTSTIRCQSKEQYNHENNNFLKSPKTPLKKEDAPLKRKTS